VIWFSRGRDSLKVKSIRGSRAVYESEEIQRVELKLETELGDKVTLEMTPQQCHRLVTDLTNAYEAIFPPIIRPRQPY